MTIDFAEGEHILHEIRKHWFVLFSELALSIFLLFLPLFGYTILKSLSITVVAIGNSLVLFLFFYALWILIMWVIILIIWTDYYLDIWIITNKRLIDVEQKGFFNRVVSTVDLENIQDSTDEVKGIIPTLLRFGNINVQTAASEGVFVIKGIDNPSKTSHYLNEAVREKKKEILGV